MDPTDDGDGDGDGDDDNEGKLCREECSSITAFKLTLSSCNFSFSCVKPGLGDMWYGFFKFVK